jgi:arylsulfatase A-like enzyme
MTHREQWSTLLANRTQPVMHMDVVPTMLGAAGIRYEDARALPVDLTRVPVPKRERFVQVRAGVRLDEDKLRRDAGSSPASPDLVTAR